MIYEDMLEEIGHEIEPERSHAQILLKTTGSSETDAEAERVVENLGVRVLEKSRLSAHWVLLKLDVKDMRGVALKLIEHGFVIKGINALTEE